MSGAEHEEWTLEVRDAEIDKALILIASRVRYMRIRMTTVSGLEKPALKGPGATYKGSGVIAAFINEYEEKAARETATSSS